MEMPLAADAFFRPYRPHERAALCADGPKSAPAALPRPLLQKNLGICELPHVGTEALSANSRRRKGDANACMDNRHRGRDWPDLVGRRGSNLVPVVADSDSTAISQPAEYLATGAAPEIPARSGARSLNPSYSS